MATTRRNFLKTSGVMAAGAALTGVPGLKTLEPAVGVDNPIEFYPTRDWEKIYRDQYRYDSTYTFICAPNDTHICRLRAFVRNGIIIRIEQDYEAEKVTDLYKNKISPAWNPRGCSKGYTFIRRIYGPYRAKYPMVRRGWREWAEAGFPMRSDGTPDPKYFRRSEDDWVRVSWDEASTFVAKGLTHIMDKYGGDKGADLLRDQGYPENMIAAMHGSGAQAIKIRPGMSLHGALRLQALKRFSNMLAFYDGKLGARSWSNYDWHGDLPPGHPMVTGVQTHDDDHNNFRHCRLFIMQGVNFVENKMADAHWWNEIMERGGKIVVIAPEYSASSTKADYWIPVRPGSDPALQLGVTQILLDEKLYDEAFVKKYTDMPLLVRLDTLKLLKASDIIPGYKNAELVGYSSTVQKIDPEMRERWGDFAVWDAKANRTVVVTRD